ncbi:MAG: hypothetical protein ACXABY_06560 [Candidatus Thorarchaeota archaeon]|jgi:hypothetical protein
MSNKVEKLQTMVTVLCSREELIRRFPKMNTSSSMQIYHNHQLIHVEERPSRDLHKVLPVLRKHVPTLSFLVEKYELSSEYYIKIGNTQYDIWNSSDKNKAKIEITSYEDNLDKHYEKVDRLKEHLMRRSIQVEAGQCEVTTKTRC